MSSEKAIVDKIMKWAANHYWDSLEKDKLIILLHLESMSEDDIELLESEPESGEFTKRARMQLDEGTLPVTKLHGADDGKYYIPRDIVQYYHEACSIIDRLEAELSLYRRQFCEAHQPISQEQTEECPPCPCCEAVHQYEVIELLESEPEPANVVPIPDDYDLDEALQHPSPEPEREQPKQPACRWLPAHEACDIIDSLNVEPPAGDFTTKCRDPRMNPQKFGKLSWREVLFEACSIIDRLEEENKAKNKALQSIADICFTRESKCYEMPCPCKELADQALKGE